MSIEDIYDAILCANEDMADAIAGLNKRVHEMQETRETQAQTISYLRQIIDNLRDDNQKLCERLVSMDGKKET